MRSVQEVLAMAERHLFYSPRRGMCAALRDLEHTGEISHEERFNCDEAIKNYLYMELGSAQAYLDNALAKCGLPCNEFACRAVYKDWASRPQRR